MKSAPNKSVTNKPAPKKSAIILKGVAILLVFAVSFVVGGRMVQRAALDKTTADGQQASDDQVIQMPDRMNVLLLGIDARPGETDARTDTMMLMSIDRKTEQVAVVSIPRDTLVEIPGHGENKINSSNAFGGADLARETVENLLGIEVPYYVKTNFSGFKDIVDTLGGVDINVEKRMYYPEENIDLQPGQQKLNGYDALGYVRYRYDALGDISRVQRQQKFVAALADEMMKGRTILKLPALIPQIMKNVETNLGARDALLLTRAAANLQLDNIAAATLPGTFLNYKGISYWKMDEEKSRDLLNDLFKGVKVATITGPEINVPADKPVGSKPAQDKTPANGSGGVDNPVPTGQSEGGGSDSAGTGGTENPGTNPGSAGSQGTSGNDGSGQTGGTPGTVVNPGSSGSQDSTGSTGSGTAGSGSTVNDPGTSTQPNQGVPLLPGSGQAPGAQGTGTGSVVSGG